MQTLAERLPLYLGLKQTLDPLSKTTIVLTLLTIENKGVVVFVVVVVVVCDCDYILPHHSVSHTISLLPHVGPSGIISPFIPTLDELRTEDINAEMKASLQHIINEREQLKVELMHAKSAIIELENQNVEYDRLLSHALSQLQACKPKQTVALTPKVRWIGTWQCSSDDPQFAKIENDWANGLVQKALSQMPAMLDREDLGPHQSINCRLLYSALLQGADLQQALVYAEEAVTMAVDLGLQELAAKGQFHRALCYHYLGKFANARWCFVLASSTDETVKEFRQKAEESLPEGHAERSVTADFKFYCDSKVDGFIRGR